MINSITSYKNRKIIKMTIYTVLDIDFLCAKLLDEKAGNF